LILVQSQASQSREKLNELVNQTINRDNRVSELNLLLNNNENEINSIKKRVDAIQSEVDGYSAENPVGKFARTRAITDWFYFPALLILAIGEVLVTQPAVFYLFGEGTVEAWIVSIAIGLLTVVGAHVIGISLKLKLDRQRPQEDWVIKLAFVLGISLFLAVVVLGILRAGQTLEKLQNFTLIKSELGQKLFLVFFFIAIQIAFIFVASKLAFLHYSKTEHDLRRAKRDFKKAKRVHDKYLKELSGLKTQQYLTPEIIEVEKNNLIAFWKIIESRYEAACAAYADANIHARRDDLNAAHPSLLAPVLDWKVEDFTDLHQIATNLQRVELSTSNT
ncbi:MAG: hypothetical protein ACO3IA_06290, partial [Candidatus Nanopelagicales bacterium]